MSFRIEEKILVKEKNSFQLKEFLNSQSCKSLYKPRYVQSLYFDNSSLDILKDSEEGLVPRKKIRIRSYPNEKDVFNLETKISSVEGRFKTTKKNDEKKFNHYINYGIFDSRYGDCTPKIYVHYHREYFSVKNTRLTYDTNIEYLDLNKRIISKEISSVLEIKTGIKSNVEELLINFPFLRTRYSKYCNGMMATKTKLWR